MNKELNKNKKWEDCWEYKVFNKIDKIMTKTGPYILTLAMIYFSIHLIISLF